MWQCSEKPIEHAWRCQILTLIKFSICFILHLEDLLGLFDSHFWPWKSLTDLQIEWFLLETDSNWNLRSSVHSNIWVALERLRILIWKFQGWCTDLLGCELESHMERSPITSAIFQTRTLVWILWMPPRGVNPSKKSNYSCRSGCWRWFFSITSGRNFSRGHILTFPSKAVKGWTWVWRELSNHDGTPRSIEWNYRLWFGWVFLWSVNVFGCGTCNFELGMVVYLEDKWEIKLNCSNCSGRGSLFDWKVCHTQVRCANAKLS